MWEQQELLTFLSTIYAEERGDSADLTEFKYLIFSTEASCLGFFTCIPDVWTNDPDTSSKPVYR